MKSASVLQPAITNLQVQTGARTYYQGISDSVRHLGNGDKVVKIHDIETHSVNSASPHVGRGETLKGELFSKQESVQPQINYEDEQNVQ